MIIRNEKITYSRLITIEPGDGFKYEFIVAYSKGSESESIYIASVSGNTGLRFQGYSYNVDSISDFGKRFPGFADLDEKTYHDYLVMWNVPYSQYIRYVAEKSMCENLTATAAILVAIKFIETVKQSGGDHNDNCG